jgi:hypothetical protein
MAVLWRRPAVISRWIPIVAKEGTALHSKTGRVRALEQEIYTFASRRPKALAKVAAYEGLFHGLGVLEAYIALQAITGRSPTVLAAFILETAQRLLMVVFKVVPFQMGVGELGTAAVTNVLGLGATAGVTVAIVRKARMAAWAGVGGALLARRGMRRDGEGNSSAGESRKYNEPKSPGIAQ